MDNVIDYTITHEIDLGYIFKNYIPDDKLIVTTPDNPIDFKISLKKFMYLYYNNGTLANVDISNFDKINKNDIIRYIFNNETKTYIGLSDPSNIKIGDSKIILKTYPIDQNETNAYTKWLDKIKTETGRDLVIERINKIEMEIEQINKIIPFMYNEILPNLNPKNKAKHFDPEIGLLKPDDRICSTTFVHYSIFKDKYSYQDALNLIRSNNILIEEISDVKLANLMSRPKLEKLGCDEYVRKMTNMFLFCKMIQCLRDYTNYLHSCLANIKNDGSSINSKYSFNDTTKNFFEFNDKNISVRDCHANALIKNASKYGFPKQYCIKKFSNGQWNIFHESDGATNTNIDITSIRRHLEYVKFMNLLDTETTKIANEKIDSPNIKAIL